MSLWLLVPLAVILAAAGVYLSFIASRPAKQRYLDPLLGYDYAHRGLFSENQSVPENSLAAFERAAAHGYGIELDVQLSADGQVVVFHDDSLKRMCGVDKPAGSLSYRELHQLSLAGTRERIPLFSEVLRLVGGRVPLIIEFKTGKRNAELCEKAREILNEYEGPFCVESFDPRILRWFRKNAKKIVRGQLSEQFSNSPSMPRVLRFALRNLFGNCIAKPHFIAYRHQDAHNLNFRLCKRLFHLLTVAWTVRDTDDVDAIRSVFDLIIFEAFLPEPHSQRSSSSSV